MYLFFLSASLKDLLSTAVTIEAPTDRIFARYLEWIQECKEAIHTLLMCIKQARAYREKCCSVLGAALGAALALEQAVYSGTLHTGEAQELQRLCAAVTAAIELAQQRVQVSCLFRLLLPLQASNCFCVLGCSKGPQTLPSSKSKLAWPPNPYGNVHDGRLLPACNQLMACNSIHGS